ncbi:MAG: phosphoribosyl-ATP diphosphatase [Anaerolineales bacterium]|nr:phosphoribosyl-ATP diphosphatase [Anaerolineales bacterium]
MNISELYETIRDRRENPTEKSYTASLFDKGLPRIVQKVGEEATEVIVAALSQEKERLVEEIGDLVYHLLVLMAAREISLDEVTAELEKRKK